MAGTQAQDQRLKPLLMILGADPNSILNLRASDVWR